MGCDIHLAVEVLESDLVWRRAEARRPNKYYEKWPEDEPQWEWDEWYHARNYALFGVLAGVRSNYDGTEAISEPRGWPDDVSDDTREKSDRYGVDGHSHSWFTLRELLDYDWERPVTDSALTQARRPDETPEQLEKRLQNYIDMFGELPEWLYPTCQAAFGMGAEKWTRVTWTVPAHGHVGPRWAWFMVRLAREAPHGDPNRIRIVFFFDN